MLRHRAADKISQPLVDFDEPQVRIQKRQADRGRRVNAGKFIKLMQGRVLARAQCHFGLFQRSNVHIDFHISPPVRLGRRWAATATGVPVRR